MKTLYKQLGFVGDSVKVLYGPHNTFTEISQSGELCSWRRLLSGNYIKLSRDMVPEEVIHQQLRAPLQVHVLKEGLEDEQLVQRWYECTVRKETSEKQTTSSSRSVKQGQQTQ